MDAPRVYLDRVRALGWPTVATGLALLFAVVALSQPVWVFQENRGGGDVNESRYGWTALVEDEWRNGVWAGTSVTPYSSPTFDQFRMREAVGSSFLFGGAYAFFLLVFAGLLYRSRSAGIMAVATRLANLIVLGIGALALAYPAMTIPAAAAIDVDRAVSGFGGSATVVGDVLTWGAGGAWWLWLVSTFLGFVVFLAPLVQRKAFARPVAVR